MKLTVATATWPFFDTSPEANGSLTEATCGPDRSRVIEVWMAARPAGPVTLAVPVLAKTTCVEGAASAGRACSSWVSACWDCVPGTLKLSTVLPRLSRPRLTTAKIATSHPTRTRRRCWYDMPARRYSALDIKISRSEWTANREPPRPEARAAALSRHPDPIRTTMAQSRPFLIPAGGQSGYQPAGGPAWPSAGVAAGRWP